MNSRLQVTEISLGQAINDGSLMRLQYEYGELQSNGIDVNGATNAGNIAKQTISFSGQSAPFVQTYTYDKLDRLTEATEKVSGTQSWRQTFGYDIYGNRTARSQIVGSTTLPINNLTLPSIDQFKNRFNLGQGYTYDSNGNIIGDLDPATGQSRTFVFNGDNKQTEVKNSSNVTIGTYVYDGTGKRVKKITAQETTVFVYDGIGKLVAEYSTATPPQSPAIHYTATDTLGSPRVITDGNGQVESRRDFMPFGEELFADGVNRQTGAKYSLNGVDAIRQRFTGYQKDIETGLDFGEARMYQNAHGRFTVVDPLMASGKSANPQTFNRYTYVVNRPTALNDPSGLQAGQSVPCTSGAKCNSTYDPKTNTVTVIGTMATYDLTDPRLAGLRNPGADLPEEDVQGVVKGGMSLVNVPFKSPILPIPQSPTFSSLTGYQPFSDEQTKTDTWRQFGISLATQFLGAAVTGTAAGEIGAAIASFRATATAEVTLPSTLARVIPGRGPFTTLGPPGSPDVFVTAAEDIASLNSSQIAERLTIPPSDVFTVIEFPTPSTGVASPVFRSNPGFVGFGRTAGGAREFVVPNGPIPCGSTIRTVC